MSAGASLGAEVARGIDVSQLETPCFVTDLGALQGWAVASTADDFVGHIKGLGTAVYHGLVMRLGVETVKPDVHILRFVSDAIGRPVNELEAVEALEQVAKRLGFSARTLDWSIWEYQRALVGRRWSENR